MNANWGEFCYKLDFIFVPGIKVNYFSVEYFQFKSIFENIFYFISGLSYK